LKKINTEYRKLKNQARFVMEIIDNKLVVSKKKKPILVAELRKREYEPFPKVKDAKKADETDDVVENEDEVTADEDAGARDYDYLLGVSGKVRFETKSLICIASYLVPHTGTCRQTEAADDQQERGTRCLARTRRERLVVPRS
jgi:hypothetical protein